MQVGQAVDVSLQLGGIILMNLGACSSLAMKNKGKKKWFGGPWRLRIAAVVSKAVTRKEDGG